MAKSIVFHIGDPKTGTSSIQEVLLHRRWTCPTVSLDYPKQLNAFPLANALWDPEQAHHKATRFREKAVWLDASEADVAVISAEQFFRVDPIVLNDAIAEYMPAHAKSARVIAYVRPHAQRFLSAFAERTKVGVYQGDMTTFFQRTKREQLLLYTPRFQAWQSVFGSRFILRPMVRDALHNGDVVADFLHQVLGGAPFGLLGVTQANTSLSLEALSGLREVQGVLREKGVPNGIRISAGQYMAGAINALSTAAGTKLRLSQELYQKISATYHADAEALDLAFFEHQPMVKALEAAAADIATTGMSVEASQHFSTETLTLLHQNANALARLFLEYPKAWTASFAQETGQRPKDTSQTSVFKTKRAHIDEVNAILTQTAAAIADPQTTIGA